MLFLSLSLAVLYSNSPETVNCGDFFLQGFFFKSTPKEQLSPKLEDSQAYV